MILNTSNISAKFFFTNTAKKNTIFKERKEVLLDIANAVAEEYKSKKFVNLNFICKHNARSSQLCQAWSFLASLTFNLQINSYSGGSEITSFHRNTIKVLQKCGFNFQLEDFSHQNPKYNISYDDGKKTFLCFSKYFDDATNEEPFIGINISKNLNDQFTNIQGATHTYHLPYFDLKSIDGTANQEQKYAAVNEQIASEIYFLFSTIQNNVS